MRYSATFAKSKGPFIDRNPKGGKEAVRKGNNPNPPFSYDSDWIKDNSIRGVSCLWKKKTRMAGWDWGWKMSLDWKKARNVGNVGSGER